VVNKILLFLISTFLWDEDTIQDELTN
jgi:hypothetical protein